ncbi:MAG TPA: ATP-binding cassette domain-containing protein [Mycobacteriales bacterium]|nr:ATP-binding cassette domain-containing protein [Mycobacteriales bacterium]
MSIPLPVVILGVIHGFTYGMLAVGLILVYRTSRVINFAHGEVGALGSAVLGVYVFRNHVPYWLMLPAALVVGAAANMLVEVVAVRRLRNAPVIMTILATLGFGALFSALDLVINTAVQNGASYPEPPGLPTLHIGALYLTQADTAEVIGTPLIVIGLVAFLCWSRFGVAMRAAASNRDNALMRGIPPGRMSLLAWGIAGAIAAFAAVMQAPSQGFTVVGQSLGPGLLVRALVVAVIARMDNLPIALVGGTALGIIEQVLLWNYNSGGQVELVMFVLMILALLLQTRGGTREREQGSWLATRAARPLPEQVAQLRTVRYLAPLGVVVVAVALTLTGLASNSTDFIMTGTLAFALIGMSVYVVTGLGGQLSLGQLAIAGVAGVFSVHITNDGVNFIVAVALAASYGAVVSVLLGIPALRIRGLMLAASTLAFAVMCESWLFNQSWAFGPGVYAKRPSFPGVGPLDTGRDYYWIAVPVFLVGLWFVWNVNRGGIRRQLVAVRDNEDGARAFAVRATRVKLLGFAIAGFLAGVGGCLYAHSLPSTDGTFFEAQGGLTVVAVAAIGGISLMVGSLFGALYLYALPQLVNFGPLGLATSDLGWLLLILYFPGGLAQLAEPARIWLIRQLARLHGVDIATAAAAVPQAADAGNPEILETAVTIPSPRREATGRAILTTEGVTKSFGGLQAVRQVSITANQGEILGLIGPNGAGKTTLFEMISGFTRPDSGVVRFRGEDITRLSPEARAERGLVRSFQDAALFPTMTVLDVVRLAHERSDPTRPVTSALGLPPALRRERRRDGAARDLIGSMGLLPYRDAAVSALSTGTRRITELACIVAMGPTLLLLDEPSSGIAQRETESLGALIRSVRERLDATVILIEHDMPLVMDVCDRAVAMVTGEVVALGTPREVVASPVVIESYLGGDITAIERSGTKSAAIHEDAK